MTEKDEIGFLDSLRESAEIQIILSFATEAETDRGYWPSVIIDES